MAALASGARSAPRRPQTRRMGRTALVIVLAVLPGLLLAVLATPSLRWRAQALALVASGRVPDLRLGELLQLMRPASAQPQLSRLLATHNPYAVIHVPEDGSASIARGARAFRAQCADCHAPDGSGGPGAPALVGRELTRGGTDWGLYRTIRDGVPGTGMAAHPWAPAALWDLVAYVRSLGRAGVAAPDSEVTAPLAAHLDVSYTELAATRAPAADWLTWGGAYSSQRHSLLKAIDRGNVHALALRWIVPLGEGPDRLEGSPLVRDGVLFVTGPLGRVRALDAASGRELWHFEHRYELRGGGEGPLGQNRGVALLGDRLFVGSWDSKLFALESATGRPLWQADVGPYPGTYVSGAPLALRDLVVVGVGSPPGFGRGFIVAYDAASGRERWRFQTVPGPGEPGHETWSGDSWRLGGAGSWVTGSYDVARDILYWGIGNPRPDFDTRARQGDNLYSDCIVALRGTTGKLLWHFQFTPADDHDWDSSQVPVLSGPPVQGDAAPAPAGERLLFANRNGFFYILDAVTGAFAAGVPFVQQNWARGLDAGGRPLRAPTQAGLQGSTVYPGAKGGTNWWPPSYDPDRDLLFVPALEQGMTFFPSAQTLPSSAGHTLYTAIRALDGHSGRTVWEYRHPVRSTDPNSSGLLSTAGGLVFGADHGQFFALDAASGRRLWSIETHGSTYAPPVAYAAGGEEYIAVIAGHDLLAFALPRSRADAP